jgi:hypothetical protein
VSPDELERAAFEQAAFRYDFTSLLEALDAIVADPDVSAFVNARATVTARVVAYSRLLERRGESRTISLFFELSGID